VWTSVVLSHVLSLSGYPFHLMRYWRCFDLPKFWCTFICSILYYSLSLIRSGGGWEKFGHAMGFHDRAIRVTHGIQGGYSMMVAVGVDMPMGKFL
jgi:hypothetical protein